MLRHADLQATTRQINLSQAGNNNHVISAVAFQSFNKALAEEEKTTCPMGIRALSLVGKGKQLGKFDLGDYRVECWDRALYQIQTEHGLASIVRGGQYPIYDSCFGLGRKL
jgi:hypothetical protein